MSISYHKVANFPFYQLSEFKQLQLLSRSKSTIHLYQHKNSKQIFVVKEIPFSQDILKIYEIVFKLQHLQNIVKVRGLCKMVIKLGKNTKKRRAQTDKEELQFEKSDAYLNQQFKGMKLKKQNVNQKVKQQEYLIIFMQKCEENLSTQIQNRLKQRKPFTFQQVMNFLSNTLLLLQVLQKQNVSHRDIKPSNFLCQKGKYKLCDFDEAVYLDPLMPSDQGRWLELTTLEYTSPQFYKNMKFHKQKYFDPFKLDVYALGITILMICSMGKFNLAERREYMLECSIYHSNFVKEERRKILKNNPQFKSFNSIVKIMLEEDEYKRDTFITLIMKIKPIINLRDVQMYNAEDQNVSDNSKSEESRRKIKPVDKKAKKKKNNWEGTTQIQRKFIQILLILGFSFFILLLII